MERKHVRRALIKVLDGLPGSLRQLARDADIPASSLTLARQGKINLTPEATVKVIRTLRSWAKKKEQEARACERLAATLERADERNRKEKKGQK